jgi:hypothetical protein
MADAATVYIGGLDLRRLHTANSTSTTATKDLINIDHVGDGVGGRGELQRVEAMALCVTALGSSRQNKGEPRFIRLRVGRAQSLRRPSVHLGTHCPLTQSGSARSWLLTVNSCIKVRLDLQADKSPVIVKGPFFPRVVNPRYRIRGTNV